MVELPQHILAIKLLHTASEWQLLQGPLTNKSYLLEEASHFGPQRHQCSPIENNKHLYHSTIRIEYRIIFLHICSTHNKRNEMFHYMEIFWIVFSIQLAYVYPTTIKYTFNEQFLSPKAEYQQPTKKIIPSQEEVPPKEERPPKVRLASRKEILQSMHH